MKKTILSIISLIVTISAMADNVSSSKAKEIASQIFNTTRAGGVSLVWDGTDGTRGSAPAFYVFNYDGGGFVVISADDCAKPVLGYSNTGSFKVDGMPSNIRGLFDGYTRQISFIRSHNIEQSAKIKALWNNVRKPSETKVLRTAKWGQGEPFNNKCPKVDDQKSVTGCVATSTAIIMRYHEWPKSQKGTLPSYTYETDKGNNRTQAGHELAASYDWSSMLQSYDGSETSVSRNAVAVLMFDLGVMLQSSYNGADGESTYGTGAYSENIIPMLVKYMDYDSSGVCLYRDEMSSKAWSDRMREEIDGNRPVSYSGSGNGGGHQFVLDGYGTEDSFHINWGWSGSNNGLFQLEALEIDGYSFSYDCTATVNIMPNKGGKPAERIKYYLDNKGKGGLVLLSGETKKGSTVKLALYHVCNFNGGYIEGVDMGSIIAKYAMCLLDKDDKIKEVYEESDYFPLESNYSFSDTVTCQIGVEPSLGDKFMFCYKTTGEWTPVEIDYSLYNYDTGTKVYNISDAVALFDFPAIKVNPDGYSAGDVLDLRIINCKYIPVIQWYYDDKEVTNGMNCIRLTSGKHTVKAVVDFYKGSVFGTKVSTETLVRVINVN